jgi:hypothetical protein
MITRVAAGLFVTAAILVSPEVFARSAGGFMGGRAVSSPPRVHAHPAIPAVHSGGALVGGRSLVRADAFGRNFFRHRARFGNRAWSGRQWYDGWYGSYGPYDYGSYDYGNGYYGATNYGPPYEPTAHQGPGYPVGGTAPDTAQKVIYVLPYRPGCDSETQKVPGKGGGEHSVTIVRC